MKHLLPALLMVSCAPPADQAADQNRAVRSAALPGSAHAVVVAEGDLEPRSTGSYSLRIYDASNPDFPYDRFVTGSVRPRAGTIEDVMFADLDRDGSSDIIVAIRSAGSGGYLSADAFQLRGGELRLLAQAAGLPPHTDLVSELARKVGAPTKTDTASRE